MNQLFDEITVGPLFIKLKDVIENNSYHDHEKTYDHLIKTYKLATEQISGDFINNQNAKKLFLEFVNQKYYAFLNKDLMVIAALLHDCGKLLWIRDAGKETPLAHNLDGVISFPGHEYLGSTIVKDFLKETSLTSKEIEKIENIVRLHGSFGADYFEPKLNWPIEEIIYDLKTRAEEFYIESLFNIYCDCYNAEPFAKCKEKIVEVFNNISLYTKREYFIK